MEFDQYLGTGSNNSRDFLLWELPMYSSHFENEYWGHKVFELLRKLLTPTTIQVPTPTTGPMYNKNRVKIQF